MLAQLEGVQPMVTIEDCVEAEELVKADPSIRALLKERYGVTDMALVACDPWYYGDRFGAHSHAVPGLYDYIGQKKCLLTSACMLPVQHASHDSAPRQGFIAAAHAGQLQCVSQAPMHTEQALCHLPCCS